mmetsp:Transcript_8622/g.18540  ORF Transcript_8622/g.18540 Transcript_8622/m.18540 type:complete len:311 (+) Transcript_8622:122-1054(+)
MMVLSSSLPSRPAIILILTVIYAHTIFLTVAAFSPSSFSRFPSRPSLGGATPSSPLPASSLSATNDNDAWEPTRDRHGSGDAALSSARRRQCVASLLTPPLVASGSFWGGIVASPPASRAAEDEPPPPDARPFLEGVASLKPGTEFRPPSSSEDSAGADAPPSTTPALYVTARPESMGSAPRTLLDAAAGRYGGKVPPVLAARFSIAPEFDGVGAFPFQFRLNAADLTEEGAFGSDGEGRRYWWEGEDLAISARLDSDGVAATRNPEDLVGRSLARAAAAGSSSGSYYEGVVTIELQGRGLFGKSVTRKK